MLAGMALPATLIVNPDVLGKLGATIATCPFAFAPTGVIGQIWGDVASDPLNVTVANTALEIVDVPVVIEICPEVLVPVREAEPPDPLAAPTEIVGAEPIPIN